MRSLRKLPDLQEKLLVDVIKLYREDSFENLFRKLYKDEDEILDKAVKAGKDTDVAYVEDVLPGKMKYNLEYLKQFSVLNDLKICIDTVIGVLR